MNKDNKIECDAFMDGIRYLIEKKIGSCHQLSRKLDKSNQYIYHLFKHKNPTLRTLMAILDVLELDILLQEREIKG